MWRSALVRERPVQGRLGRVFNPGYTTRALFTKRKNWPLCISISITTTVALKESNHVFVLRQQNFSMKRKPLDLLHDSPEDVFTCEV